MYLSTVALATAFLTATTQACYDDSHVFRRSADGSSAWSYTGKMQTPINLDSNIKLDKGADYVMKIPKGKTGSFENKGHAIEVGQISGGTLKFGNGTYDLLQFHFHAPSEHRIDDEFFPMEVHFVHKSKDGALAVVGFVIELGRVTTPLLRSVLRHIDKIKEADKKTKISSLDFTSVTSHLSKHDVFRYQGSLTTPPCTEGLEWIVSKEPLIVDMFLFNQVKKIIKFNSRYTQSRPGEINLLEPLAKMSSSATASS